VSHLDLHDIQGNIVKAYGRYGFPKGRYVLFSVCEGDAGRAFVQALAPTITTSAPWRMSGHGKGTAIPEITTNIAFTYRGLKALGVPRASLQTFPDEFAMGMRARRDILGDDGVSAPENWDPVWIDEQMPVDILISINGRDDACLEKRYQEILALSAASGDGVVLLKGHSGPTPDYQAATAIYDKDGPTAKEHFGYTDGIGDPFFKGVGTHESNLIGGGKVTGKTPEGKLGWEPLETGEFILGYKDEAYECPEAPSPKLLSHNGTFMVYRKLHENTESFDKYIEHMGKEFPGGKEALAAKFAGRWRNGAPVSKFPSEQEASEFAERWNKAKQEIAITKDPKEREQKKASFAELNQQFSAFDYRDDSSGGRCPLGAHIRRANPRSALEFNKQGVFETPGALANRRRMIRRGLPYGASYTPEQRRDGEDHGIVFMAIGASIRRQFEFVQQQWMNYGNDFQLANEKDALLGNHGQNERGGTGTMVVQSDPEQPEPPFFCAKIPRFVETRGGEYFFVPSLTALRMIGEGSIDPT
jgi:Dyp-type peroxidase family